MNTGLNVSVVASGVLALSLALAAILYMAGTAIPSLQIEGDKFFGFAVFLAIVMILASLAGARLRFR